MNRSIIKGRIKSASAVAGADLVLRRKLTNQSYTDETNYCKKRYKRRGYG
jgi:hypothetical protein